VTVADAEQIWDISASECSSEMANNTTRMEPSMLSLARISVIADHVKVAHRNKANPNFKLLKNSHIRHGGNTSVLLVDGEACRYSTFINVQIAGTSCVTLQGKAASLTPRPSSVAVYPILRRAEVPGHAFGFSEYNLLELGTAGKIIRGGSQEVVAVEVG
jgi:hypothetical protein